MAKDHLKVNKQKFLKILRKCRDELHGEKNLRDKVGRECEQPYVPVHKPQATYISLLVVFKEIVN